MHKIPLLSLLFMLSLVLGYARDVIFKSVNAILDHKAVYNSTIPISSWLIELGGHINLNHLKWILTLFFMAVFAVLHLTAVRLYFSLNLMRQILKLYFAIASAFLIYAFAIWVFGYINDQYAVIRGVLGLFQSPIPFLISFPVLIYWKNRLNKS